MKFKGKEFLEDIRALKKLRNNNKPEYKKLMAQLCKKYDTSEKTIYREMAKKTPGVRRTRKDAGKSKTKITAKEKAIVKELLDKGEKKTKVKKALEQLTRKKTSTRKLYKVTSQVKNVKPLNETTFGKEFGSFIEKHFDLDFWGEGKEKTVKLGKYVFPLTLDEVQDIKLILINAWNRYAETNGKKLLKIDRLDLSRSKLYNLFAYRLKLAEAETDLKTIRELVDIQNTLNVKRTALPLDFDVFDRVCKSFKPDITIDEEISLLKEHGKKSN